MRRSYALSPSVTSRVPHGSLDVDARLGFRRTRPRSTLQVLPAQRFVDGTPYPRPAKAGRQEPRKILFPGAILAHLPLTMLCPPGADVGESSPRHGEATIPVGDGFYSSPTPPRFYKAPHRLPKKYATPGAPPHGRLPIKRPGLPLGWDGAWSQGTLWWSGSPEASIFRVAKRENSPRWPESTSRLRVAYRTRRDERPHRHDGGLLEPALYPRARCDGHTKAQID
jgi:hypothetical protein